MTALTDAGAALRTTEATRAREFGDLLLAEWTKLRTVRSTYWAALMSVLLSVGLAALVCARLADDIRRGDQSLGGFDPTTASLDGLYIAQLAIGALGVLTISSEYGTGMIHATLAAFPRRRTVLAAKGAVFAAATFVAGTVMSFAAFAAGQPLLAGAHASATLGQPGVLRALVGGGLYLMAVGLLGFGLGALIRHTAGALSAFFGVMFAGNLIIDLLPTAWHNTVIAYLPANAGTQIITTHRGANTLAPWVGYGVLCAYAAVVIIAAMALVNRRDA